MNAQIIILFLCFCKLISYGQTQIRSTTTSDLKGVFVLYWEISEKHLIGEKIEIGKRHKFEYRVFATAPGELTKFAEQVIVKGRYSFNGDTLNLIPVEKPTQFNSETFNLKSKFLIRTLEAYSDDGLNRIIHCLVAPEKIESFNHVLELMPARIAKYHLGSDDLLLNRRLNQVGLETEMLFYEERIFINLR